MRRETLIQLSAGAGVTGGALRVASSFLGETSGSPGPELLYLVIDLGLLFAIPGVYLSRHSELGVAGLIGFVLALCGAASIVGPDGALLGIDMYRLGGGALMLGLAVLAVAQLRLGPSRICSSIGWLMAVLLLIGAVATPAGWLFTLMGVLFGLAFVVSGLELVREVRRP